MKQVLGFLFIVAGVLSGLYVGGWMLFIKPIINACKMFDAGTLTGVIVGTTVLKCIFASLVGSVIAWLGFFVGSFLLAD